MNLEQSINQAALRAPVKALKPKTRSKYQVAKRVFDLAAAGGFPYTKMTSQQWANMWLKSDEFRLMEIDIAAAAALNINAAASPHTPKNPNRVEHYMHCSVESLDPIVVDLNKRKVGRSYLGYVPPVIVLDGKHRKMAQLRQGRTRILAWVGCKALAKMPPTTVHEVDECPCKTKVKGNKVMLPQSDSTPMAAAYEMYAATVPSVNIPSVSQSAGEGGARPHDHMHSGGPGSGRHAEAGTFKHTGTAGDSKYYKGSKGTVVRLHEPSRPSAQTKVFESIPGETKNETQIYRNYTSGNASQYNDYKSFIKNRYGIDAMGGPGMSNQGGANVVKAKGSLNKKFSPVSHMRDKMTMKVNQKSGEIDVPQVKAEKDMCGCGARSSGTLVDDTSNSDHKIPPDASDASTFVEPSDQLKWNGKKSNNYAPGTKPGYVDQFGSPNFQAPGSGVGQRILNKGGSKSDFSRQG